MSTMALQLPSSYVEIERKEMEYVNGGGYLSDMAALLGALAAFSGVLVAYGALSTNKKNSIESKFGVRVTIAGTIMTISLIGYGSRKVVANIWGGIKGIFGF